MSFWKHEPPKPTPAFRKLGPMRLSEPIARATSSTLAPVRSQIAATALIELTRCARKAFAASLESSADQTLVARMRSRGTQWA